MLYLLITIQSASFTHLYPPCRFVKPTDKLLARLRDQLCILILPETPVTPKCLLSHVLAFPHPALPLWASLSALLPVFWCGGQQEDFLRLWRWGHRRKTECQEKKGSRKSLYFPPSYYIQKPLGRQSPSEFTHWPHTRCVGTLVSLKDHVVVASETTELTLFPQPLAWRGREGGREREAMLCYFYTYPEIWAFNLSLICTLLVATGLSFTLKPSRNVWCYTWPQMHK